MGVRSRSEVNGRQSALSIAGSVISLTVPDAANCAEIYVETAAIRFTREGTDPTGTLGFVAYPGDIILLNSRAECDQFEAIRDTSSLSATLEVEYFSDISG
jgi:hypothetical protein